MINSLFLALGEDLDIFNTNNLENKMMLRLLQKLPLFARLYLLHKMGIIS
jgi:hypothetical protein